MTRRTRIRIEYAGANISRDIARDLVRFTWTDNASGRADDLEITLKNDHGAWSGEWYPAQGDSIRAWIIIAAGEVYCGEFQIDEVRFSAPPAIFSIRAQSADTKAARNTKKSVAWEGARLSEIARDIATAAGLDLVFDAPADPYFDRVEQSRETDLAFLNRLCKAEAYGLKITDGQIAVYSAEAYDARAPIGRLDALSGDLIAWALGVKSDELASSVRTAYLDPDTGKLIESEFIVPAQPAGQGTTGKY